MNVWIFALSAVVFSPVIEPLGITLGAPSTAVEAASIELTDVPMLDPTTVDLPPLRYRGIEKLFAKLESAK